MAPRNSLSFGGWALCGFQSVLSAHFPLLPLPRVAPVVLFLEVEDREFGVMLEGVQRLVPQQLLDVVHVGTAAERFSSATPQKW